jgi:hypothetical protein
MKSTALVLVGLFVAQLAVAGVLYYNTWSQRAVRPQGNLLALSAEEVSRLSIEGEGESVTLERKDDTWVIASSGLPAETSRVDTALQSFSDMKLGWAVASTDASHQQLEVADDNYQRRVTLNKGDDIVGEIFIGTSPGFKRSHVRRQGTDEVYSVAINAFDLPPEPGNWLDSALLQVADISSVTIDNKELTRVDDQWVYDGSSNTDQDVAGELVSALEDLRVTEVAEVTASDLEFQQLRLTAGDAEYEFGFANKESDYLVTRQDIDAVFKISKSSYDRVVAAELITPEPATEPPGEPASDDSGEDNGSPASTVNSGIGATGTTVVAPDSENATVTSDGDKKANQ